MKLFQTQTLQGTKLWINPNHIQFIQENRSLGFVIVFQSGATHNFSVEETNKIMIELKGLENEHHNQRSS